jgi:hypothetical protein
MMTDQQKMDFVHKQTKLALEHVQHFDAGGTALGGPTATGTQNAINPASQGVLGGLGNFLGTNNNFQATGANIQQGTNAAQLNQAYTGAQGALQQAGNLNNQLTPGVAQGAGTQNTLTQQLQAQALGGGPQVGQAQLNQNTAQNIAQQAALAASTRGAGANAGLIAQNAGAQGAATQQQAVGQGAAMGAQQQLASQQQLANLAAQQVGQGTTATQLANQSQQGEQNILQGANTAANQQAVSMQENINNVNAGVAAGNQNANLNTAAAIGQGISSLGKSAASLGGAYGGQVPFAQGGMANLPPHLAKMHEIYHAKRFDQGGAVAPSAPTSPPEAPPQNAKDMQKGATSGATSPSESWTNLKSGLGFDQGGTVSQPNSPSQPLLGAGGQPVDPNSHEGQARKNLSTFHATGGPVWQNETPATVAIDPGAPVNLPQFVNMFPSKQQGSAPSSKPAPMPTEAPAQAQAMANAPAEAQIPIGSGSSVLGANPEGGMMHGGGAVHGAPMQKQLLKEKGGKVPGKMPEKDAYKNDTVSAKLTPGEVVIDVNTLRDQGKLGQMARFVAKEIERKKAGRKLA